jgi:hypothetical protein
MTKLYKTPTMKTILLGLLLFTGIVKAQIVNIPDPNFKARLLQASPTIGIASTQTPDIDGYVTTYNKIDTNNDGEIQVSEALAIKWLNVPQSNIANLTGIESFTNLEFLDCSDNQLTNLNVSGLTNLQTLWCINNQITSLNASGLTNLRRLFCYNNQLSSLNVSGLTNLQDLNCNNNQLLSLNVSGLTNLKYLYCINNQLPSLNVSGLTNLLWLNCYNNQLTNLNVSGLTNLQDLNCNNNQLLSLNVSGLSNLQQLICLGNQITSLDVSGSPYIQVLNCAGNQLINLNVKNGNNSFTDTLTYFNNPTLQYICADEVEIASIQNQITQYGYTNCHVNSYCSFTPGGAFYTIQGNNRYDSNANGCDASDSNLPNLKFNLSNGITTGTFISNTSGSYTIPVQAGNLTVTPIFENPTYFSVSPTTATVSFPTAASPFTQDFCVAPNGVYHDLEVVLAPITPARPGFDATYKIVYKNKGNQTLSGNITFNYNDAVLDFVSATQTPTSQATGSLSWNYSNLLPFENRSFYVTLNVNSPMETPAVNNDDQLDFNVTINPIAGDEIPTDNLFNYKQIVVGSYDPNDITCLEGETVSPSEIGNYLHYVINFENLGTFYAENVVVKTEIDPTKYDIATLQLLNTSHLSYTRITGNTVEFIFEDINLAAAAGNPPVGGHGDVLFKIKTKDNLVTNDSVLQRAGIYFDYNFPVITNDAETTFAALNNPNFELDNSVKVYPNPSKGNVNINCNFNIKSIALYDVQGRILETNLVNDVSKTIDISTKQNGIYFIKITTDKGIKVEKLIKE